MIAPTVLDSRQDTINVEKELSEYNNKYIFYTDNISIFINFMK